MNKIDPRKWATPPADVSLLGTRQAGLVVNRLLFIPDYSHILTQTFVINFNLDLRSAQTKSSIISLFLYYRRIIFIKFSFPMRIPGGTVSPGQ